MFSTRFTLIFILGMCQAENQERCNQRGKFTMHVGLLARQHQVLQTLQFADARQEILVNLAALATLVPELRVTVIDAMTGLNFKSRSTAQRQSIQMPEQASGLHALAN